MDIIEKNLESFDGTRICYQVTGAGRRNFVLCPGLGGSITAFKHIINEFHDRFRFFSWDYRGLYKSGKPPGDKVPIGDHVRDLQEILKKERVRRAVFGGWSMGVQVSLESWRSLSKTITGYFLINGTYGRAYDTAFNIPLSKHLIPKINAFLASLSHLHKPVIRKVISYEKALDFFNTLGLVGSQLDREVFKEIVDGFMDLDFKVYYKLMDSLGEHDASDLLPRIRVPTLIVSSEKDVMTPPSVIDTMVKEIPGAEHFSMPAGSHYSAIEYPEILNLRLDKFFRDHFPGR